MFWLVPAYPSPLTGLALGICFAFWQLAQPQ